MDALLRSFEEAGRVEEGCEGIFELLRTANPWQGGFDNKHSTDIESTNQVRAST